MKIIIIKNSGKKLDVWESCAHYFLSILPWIFVIYIFAFVAINEVNLYDAIVGNMFNLIFGLITLAWMQTHLVTKNKLTAYDFICGTRTVKTA